MSSTSEELQKGLEQWKTWASSADRESDGWETHYPGFDLLMQIAFSVMQTMPPEDPATVKGVDLCWAISEEDEFLVDCFRDHKPSSTSCEMLWLERLADSQDSRTRWQVASALGGLEWTDKVLYLLEKLSNDSHDYVRRRALLELIDSSRNPNEYLRKLQNDADPYNREVGSKLACENE